MKIGDKVKVITDSSYFGVDEKNGGLGAIGTIVDEIDFLGKLPKRFRVKSQDFVNYSCEWWFEEPTLVMVDGDRRSVVPVSSHSSCPRCKGGLKTKTSQDPFTGEQYTINKCNSCGWCD